MQNLSTRTRTAWPDTTERDANGVMHIGGVSLPELVQEFGTPLYVYDEVTLRSRAREIRDIFCRRHTRIPGCLRREGRHVASTGAHPERRRAWGSMSSPAAKSSPDSGQAWTLAA